MSEMTPLEESVLKQFLTNLQNGGIAACRAMVNDLAAEAGMTNAVSDGAQAVQDEAILAQDSLPMATVVDSALTGNEAAKASIDAMTRHSFALFLLHRLEDPQT